MLSLSSILVSINCYKTLSRFFKIFTNDPERNSSSVKPESSQRLFFSERAAIDRAQKIIQQSLARRRIVKHVANQRCFGRLLDKVAQTFRGRVQALEKESIDGGITGRQLRRMQIPALIKTADERMLDMIVVQLPGAMDDRRFSSI